MSLIVRQSTARTCMVGPVLDATGVAVTDCVVADFEGSVNGGDPAALNGSATLTHRGVGFYSLALTATDLGTVGSFEVTINDTVNACPMKVITVIEEAVYDALFVASATGMLAANVTQWLGSAAATPTVAGVPEVDVTHWLGTAAATPTVAGVPEVDMTHLVGVAQSATDLKDFADDGYDPATNKVQGVVLADAVTVVNGLAAGVVTAAAIATGAIDADAIADGAIDAGAFAANAITAAKLDPDVTTELQAGLATAAALAVVDGIVDDILLDTAEIGTAGAGLTNINLPNQTMDIIGNITGNLSGSVGSVTGNVSGNVTGTVGGFTTAAKAEIQTEAEDAIVTHRLDELLNADSDIDGAAPPTVGSVVHEMLSKTAGSFTFDQTTDSLEAVRDRGDVAWTTATGFSTLTQADVRTAVGLGSANLDTQLDALPTNAELAAADDAVLAAIAALNNLSQAQVLTQVNAALDATIADSVPADGSRPSIRQGIYMNTQFLLERTVSGTTLTVMKPDGVTTLYTLTLNDATTPTALTRAT